MILLRYAAILGIVAYLAIAAAMFLLQRSLLYFPTNNGLTPEGLGITGVTVNRLTTSDGETIIVWYAAAPAGRPTIQFFHGNAGEIGERDGRLKFYQANGFGICFVSYRGYGGSTGTPTEAGLMTDAATAYDWLRGQGIAAKQIALVGESLGTGIAIQTAARSEVGALALEAPYTSAVDVASPVYWWLPVRWLMLDQLRSIDYVASIKAPVLLMHGDADTIIPFSLGARLYEALPGIKELNRVAGGTHDAIHDEATWAREVEFFNRMIGK